MRSKKEASKDLKAALSERPSSVKAEVVYCVRFPSLSEHSSHAVVGEVNITIECWLSYPLTPL